MINAKTEFIDHTKDKKAIMCADIKYGKDYGGDVQKFIVLPMAATSNQIEMFLAALDFEYDAGYGNQYLFGTIWYIDGTWSSRGEYDGSEWWEYNKCPEIPELLKNTQAQESL